MTAFRPTLVRGWINAPSVHQTSHPMHGQRVIYDSADRSAFITVYFTSGPVTSARLPRGVVSPGWPPTSTH